MPSLYPKVLFFLRGMTPTEAQISEADNYGPGVVFRNALLIHPDGPIEEADGVAGDVPENYAEALPNIGDRDAVIERWNAKRPGEPLRYPERANETPERRAARIENALSRGARPAPINERNSDPALPSQRTSQSGELRPARSDKWDTNPASLNDAADKGQGVGATEGDQGPTPHAALGPQGQGTGAGTDDTASKAAGVPSNSAAANPRSPAGTGEGGEDYGADPLGERGTKPKADDKPKRK